MPLKCFRVAPQILPNPDPLWKPKSQNTSGIAPAPHRLRLRIVNKVNKVNKVPPPLFPDAATAPRLRRRSPRRPAASALSPRASSGTANHGEPLAAIGRKQNLPLAKPQRTQRGTGLSFLCVLGDLGVFARGPSTHPRGVPPLTFVVTPQGVIFGIVVSRGDAKTRRTEGRGQRADDGGRKTGHEPRVTASPPRTTRKERRVHPQITQISQIKPVSNLRKSAQSADRPSYASTLPRGVPPPLLPSRKDRRPRPLVLATTDCHASEKVPDTFNSPRMRFLMTRTRVSGDI